MAVVALEKLRLNRMINYWIRSKTKQIILQSIDIVLNEELLKQ